MMSLGSNGNNNNNIKFPFTATQWQELEHQALIYKYMISGLPIPPHLLFSVKRSLDSSIASSLLLQPPHQHTIGWNNLEMSYGRKIDPEPGRCRRTDGKKWRCSKEAYTDSKYCERHMHRGRNRSRKPVEININTNITSNTKPISSPLITRNSSSSLFSHSNPTSLSSMTFVDTPPSYDTTHLMHPYSSSSSRSLGFGFPSQERDTDYRYGYGMKEETDEHSFFSESSGSLRNYSDSHSTLAHLKRNTSDLGYPFLHLNDSSKQQKQDQYFHITDSDFDREMPMKLDGDDIKPHQVMHHFFDELPKDRDSWEDKSSNYLGASTTQLSISTPSYDFFMAHNDK